MPQPASDPGPFQKYLFSGASYVQVGECYLAYLKWFSSPQDEVLYGELQHRMVATWDDAFFRQMATASILPGNPWSALSPGFERSILEFADEVKLAGARGMDRLLSELLDGRDEPLDLHSFFQAWATACDSVYGQLVRSPAFSKLLGQVTNACIDRVCRESGS